MAQRNDPCPCGSGRKYKQCCMKRDKARAQLNRSSRSIEDLVKPDTIPYFFWKKWNEARARGELALLYAMTALEGPYRSQFADEEAFCSWSQNHRLPLGDDWQLQQIKVDEKKAYILGTRGLKDNRRRYVDLNLMHLVKTPEGWRVFDFKEQQLLRGEDAVEVSFGLFEVESAYDGWLEQVASGYERPDLADSLGGEEKEKVVGLEPLEKEEA